MTRWDWIMVKASIAGLLLLVGAGVLLRVALLAG